MLEFGIKEIIQKSSENQSNNRYIIKDIQLGSRCSVTRLSPLKLSNFEANIERDSGLGEEEVDVDLPRSLASQENTTPASDQRVSRNGPWERIALTQRTPGRVSENNVFFFFYLSRDTYQNRSNRSRIAHESARTRLSTRQDVDSNDPSSNVTNCSF